MNEQENPFIAILEGIEKLAEQHSKDKINYDDIDDSDDKIIDETEDDSLQCYDDSEDELEYFGL